ncbi:MAG TPA: hypothetical protein VJA27_03370 [Patescibacteria group bacterium]|nr:hypothetical protein [Patescibacteria group bacterium]
MSLKQYLILMSVGTLLCWVAWLFVVWSLDPNETTFLGLSFFYASLFLAIVGTFSVIGFLFRRALIKQDEIIFRHVRRTFRQSVLIAILATVCLLLLSEHLLRWWNAILLLMLGIIIEAIVFTKRRYSNVDYVQ